MHSKICLLFIALLLPLYAFNQIPTFEKHYDTLGCYYSNCVRQNIDGGYILCGSSYHANTAQDAAIIRTDSLGNIIWVKEYGTATTDGAIGCLIASDSNLIIVGIKEGFSAWDSKVWLLKLDQNGDTIWTKTIQVEPGNNTPKVIEKTRDGGYIITGYCTSGFGTNANAFLIKIDSIGNTTWARAYGYAGVDDSFTCTQTFDGGYLLAGGTDHLGSSAIYLVKTDVSGDTLWTKIYEYINVVVTYSVKETLDSNIILTGNVWDPISSNYDVYLAKLNSTGDFIWENHIGDNLENIANCIQVLSDGNYIIAGTTRIPFSNFYQAYLIKANNNGDTLWTKKFGGTDTEYGFYVDETRDGGLILTGQTYSFGQPSMYLVKTDNNGSLVGIDEQITETEIIIFPNPAHDYVYISGIPANFVNNVNLSITDLLGRRYLYEDFKINTIPFRFDISFLNNGVYLLNLTSGNNKLLNKIIIKL